MTTETHYTYITRSPDGRYYIGVRSCEGDPTEDPYMGSHSDPTYHPSRKRILVTFDSREEAMEHEIYLHELRQVDTNPRYANKARQRSTGFYYSNSTPGELHPMWGKTHSEEARAKISQRLSGRPSHLRGTKFSEERRAHQRKLTRGENNGMYGRTHSEETRARLREANLGKKASAETCAKLSESSEEWWSSEKGLATRERFSKEFAGENNPFHGRTHSESVRARLSEVHSGKTISEEQKRAVAEIMTQLKWYHNPETGKQGRFRPEQQPAGYILGRGKKNLTVNTFSPEV